MSLRQLEDHATEGEWTDLGLMPPPVEPVQQGITKFDCIFVMIAVASGNEIIECFLRVHFASDSP